MEFTFRAWLVAVFVMVTVTPTITAPLVSATEPVISALFCASAGSAADASRRNNVFKIVKRFHIAAPFAEDRNSIHQSCA